MIFSATGQRILAGIHTEPKTAQMLAQEVGCSLNCARVWVRHAVDEGKAMLYRTDNHGTIWVSPFGYTPPIRPGTVEALIVKWSRPADNELSTDCK